ncbi:integrase, catalytic region, zinc finger, CCHC-type containing protein [Tanacetum coccineum]
MEVIKLLDAELIYPISDSPWVSPVHCVPDKGGMTVVKNEDNELIPTRLVTGWRVCIDYRKLNDATSKDHFPLPFMDQMLERLVGNEYYCFLDGFFGYFQIPIDPKDQDKTTFTCPYGTFAYRRMPFGLCNAPGTFQRIIDFQKSGIEVNKAKVDVIANFPHPTSVKEDIQCAGSDTRPPMLDKADFASWQQRIRLYCRGHSIWVLNDLEFIQIYHRMRRIDTMQTFEQQTSYFNGLEGLPKDIYSLINHYTDAKDIWDNVKMLLEGSKLTKEDRESQLYDDFEHFCQNKGETIHDYYVRFAKLINDMRNIKMTMSKIQLNSKFVNNMLPEWGHIARNYTQPKHPQSSEYFKDKMLLMQDQENGVVLDEEQLLFLAGGQDNVIDEDVDEQPVQDLALNVDNVFQADDCDAAGPSYDSDVLSEVHDHDHYQDAVCDHHEEHEMHDDVQPNHVVDSHANYTSDSNMTPYDQYVKDNAVAVVQNNASMVPNDAYVMIDNVVNESDVLSVSYTP